jgi:hypothetical protein
MGYPSENGYPRTHLGPPKPRVLGKGPKSEWKPGNGTRCPNSLR